MSEDLAPKAVDTKMKIYDRNLTDVQGIIP